MNKSALLTLLLAALSTTAWAQTVPVHPIAPATYYRQSAAFDNPPIASYDNVAKWLQEKSVILVDVRNKEEYEEQHIRGAIHIAATDLTDEVLARAIPSKDARIVLYCNNNLHMSRRISLTTMAYPAFRQLGYNRVLVMQEPHSGLKPETILPLEGVRRPRIPASQPGQPQ